MVRRPVCIIIVCTNVYGIAYGQTKLHDIVLLMLGASVLQASTEQYNELAGSVHVLSDRLLQHTGLVLEGTRSPSRVLIVSAALRPGWHPRREARMHL